MSKDNRDKKVRKVLSETASPITPTDIARQINEPWCMVNGYPQSAPIVPVLRRIRAVVVSRGKYQAATAA